jgi:hypothetical protein
MIFPLTEEVFWAIAMLRDKNRVKAKERKSFGLCMFILDES